METLLCQLLLSNCVVWDRKKLTFIKNQKLSNDKFKMNKNVYKFLSTGDKFMLKLFLKQPVFTYSACGPLNILKEFKNLEKQVI